MREAVARHMRAVAEATDNANPPTGAVIFVGALYRKSPYPFLALSGMVPVVSDERSMLRFRGHLIRGSHGMCSANPSQTKLGNRG